MGVAAFAAMLAIGTLTRNRLIRRKLRLSLLLLVAYIGIDLAISLVPSITAAPGQLNSFAMLALAAAVINAAVFLIINPFREDRVPERFPIILQDSMVIALLLIVSTFLSAELLTTSAVSAVVLGFALQDTLGNAFAGLAIQSERPFHVGQWVQVGGLPQGRVAEVTWRATKLRTKAGNLVILPNNVVAKEAIVNYSEPAGPLRLEVDVGAEYGEAPNTVKGAILEAIGRCSRVLAAPAPDVLLLSFDDSAITYRARFWIDDFGADDEVMDEVRTAIYYAFQRHNIEIPWPHQVSYEREWSPPDYIKRINDEERLLENVDLFVGLQPEVRRQIAEESPMVVFGAGETIVKQGEGGQSMFVVLSGAVSVVLEPAREEIARIERGGYFGEMSLLTGEPRSATVIAVGDVVVVELVADLFRRIGGLYPQAIDEIGAAAVARRAGLEQRKALTAGAGTSETSTLLARMKKFLRLR